MFRLQMKHEAKKLCQSLSFRRIGGIDSDMYKFKLVFHIIPPQVCRKGAWKGSPYALFSFFVAAKRMA